MEHKIENVLLIGNGLTRAYDGVSWDELLTQLDIRKDKSILVADLDIPEPLKAVYITKDSVSEALAMHKEQFFGEIKTDTQMKMLRRVLSIGFDHILTTNYGYELEFAAMGEKRLSEKKLTSITRHTDEVKVSERKYLLHTYNEVNGSKIWHIHGEARKIASMQLGHYSYGNTLFKIKDLVQKRKGFYAQNQSTGVFTEAKSWVDAFILGNLYVLGFGFNFSEFDLWWLLNRRKREKASTGRIIFYEMDESKNAVKHELLDIMGVEVRSLGFKKNGENSYASFYEAAIEDISKEVANSQFQSKELVMAK